MTSVSAPPPSLREPSAASTELSPAGKLRWPVVVYCCSRLAIFLVAGLDALLTHRGLTAELSLFDGQWYLRLAAHGYPAHALHAKSTLGFFPLYPLVIRALASLGLPLLAAALITSFTGGLIAAVLIQRLATIWWGQRTARRAVAVFCLFPGSIVFSMAYSEGLTLPLVIGCLLALRSGRWLAAGLLAGLAGVAEPAALALFPVCVVVAAREIKPFGLKVSSVRRSLLAPLLAPAGLAAFAAYLWYRTGTPLAAYQAQRYGWHQGNPVTLLRRPLARHLLEHPMTIPGHLLNLSLWNGLLGSAFLICALLALARVRHELTPGVLAWTVGVGVLSLWSLMTLTNARMLLIAFPAVIVWARILRGRRFSWFLTAEIALLLIASGLTLAGHMTP